MGDVQVKAIITAEDKASAVLKAMAKTAENMARELEKAGAAADISKHLRASDGALNHQLSMVSRLSSAFKDLSKSAAAYAALKFPHIAAEAIHNYLPLERTNIVNQAAGNFSAADMAKLKEQQSAFARLYGELPDATAHAQGEFVKRHMDAETTSAFMVQAEKAAKAWGVDVAQAAKTLESIVFGFGEHVENAKAVNAIVPRYLDLATNAQKKGAMSVQDVEEMNKYGAAAMRAAGATPEQAFAMAMVLKREQFQGAEIGVFERALGARLMMPTAEGRAAFAAAGLDFNGYVTRGKFSGEGLNVALQEKFGGGLNAERLSDIQKAFDGGAIRTQAEFAKQVIAAYEAQHGSQRAGDRAKLGTTAGYAWKASQDHVDGAKVLDELMGGKMTAQQGMMLLGVKQGSKIASMLQQLEKYHDYFKEVQERGTTDRIAEERQKGLAAAIDRMKASYEDAANKFVEANSDVLKSLADLSTRLASSVGAISPEHMKAIGGIGAAAAVLGGAYGVASTVKFLKTVNDAARKLAGPMEAAAEAVGKFAPMGEAAAEGGLVAGLSSAAAGALRLAKVLTGVAGAVALVGSYFGYLDDNQETGPDGKKRVGAGIEAEFKKRLEELKHWWSADEGMAAKGGLFRTPTGDDARLATIGHGPHFGFDITPPPGSTSPPTTLHRGQLTAALHAMGIDPIGAGHPSFGRSWFGEGGPAKIEANVTGTVTGEGTIKGDISVTPSPWFQTTVSGMQRAIMELSGTVANVGYTMSGLNAPSPNVGRTMQGTSGASPPHGGAHTLPSSMFAGRPPQ